MEYYGAPAYPATPIYNPSPVPAYVPVYPSSGYGSGFWAALVVVVVILLIILGALYFYHTPTT